MSSMTSNHTPLTEEKRQIAEAAKRKAMEILRDALKKKDRVLMEKPQELVFDDSGDPIFWMKRHAILTEELVRGLISELEAVKFKEDQTRENTYAYVYSKSGDKTVYLCQRFWKASKDLEEYSQPGTLIHEVSHFLGKHDITYSKSSIYVACRGKLVKSSSDPDAPDLNSLGKAVLNADNITYEFEITLNHKGRYKNGQYSCCGEKAENSVCERAVPDEFLIHYFPESEKKKNIGEIMKKSLLPAANRLQSHVTQLRNTADEVDETHKNATKANVCGGSVGIVGGVAGLAGLVKAPVTFGASLALPRAGFAVSTGRLVSNAAATITDAETSSNKKNEVEKILKECQGMLERIETEFKIRTNGSDTDSSLVLKTSLGAGTTGLSAEIQTEAAKIEKVIETVNKFYGSVERK
ncbi:acyl-CoA dehydrogenase [Platysternon megacephalum]|uniref:Acyl-CoA dehydrogenase n=1 Tax=Platysternon megacephalum TaxID=55544 RepID=A0A4D9DF90_9SAUR|nr:acyl-CoA dehydrogenase [Platysternon megacephalum]